MTTAERPLRSGELARLTGVSPDTIRHYERAGILPAPPRSMSGYRMYSPGSVERVLLTQRALRVGFSLAELAEILRVRDQGGVPCRRVLDMTEKKLRSLARQIQELRRAERYIRQLVRSWQSRLAHTPPGKKAHLLQSFNGKGIPRPESADNLKRRKRK